MAKNDNKELHSILEQLKKSYSEVDGSLDTEDEVSESTTDANDDFQKLLTNFFSTDFVEEKNEDTYNFNVIEEKVEYNDEPEEIIEETLEEPEIEESIEEFIEEPEIEESIEDFIEEPEIEESIEGFIEEPEIEESIEEFIEESEIEESIEEFIEEPEIDEPIEEFIEEPVVEEPTSKVFPTVTENILAEPINKTGRDEVTAVENVFRIMFGAKQPQKEDAEPPIEEASRDEYYEDYNIVENDVVEDEVFEEPIVEAFEESSDEINISFESDKEDSDEIFYSDDEDEIFEDYEYDEAEEFDDSYDLTLPILEYDDDDLTPVAYMEDISKEEEEPYYYDPLQGHLSDAVYLVHKSVDEKLEFNTRQREIDLDDDDISLLLDFGYDDEIKSEAGAGRTNEIKRQKKSGKAPQKSERILGYLGDEYMGHAQDKDIKNKYIYDKKKIIVRIACIAVLAIIMLSLSILYHADLYIDRAVYPYIEILALLMTAAVAAPGLIEGARGIAKLDPKNYSIPVFLMIVQFIYDVFAIALQSSADSDSKMITCGFVVILYVGVSLVADALECSAQMNTFDVISSDGRLYSAEKFIKPKNEGNDKANARTVSPNVMLGNCIYKVKETDTAHGYFSRMSQKSDKCLRIMYFMGILPIVALIMGCVSLIENGEMTLNLLWQPQKKI